MSWHDVLRALGIDVGDYKTDEEYGWWLEQQRWSVAQLQARQLLWGELRRGNNEQLGYLTSRLVCALGMLYGVVDRPLTHFNAVLLLIACTGYFAFRFFAARLESRLRVLRIQLGLLKEE